MPPRTVSYDLKLRIPVLRHVYGYSINKICEVLGIRKSLVYKTLHLCHTLRCRQSQFMHSRPSSQSQYEDINYIKSHCHLHSSAFLDELQSDLLSQRGVKVSVSTLLNSATSWYHTQGSISSRP